MVFESLEVVGEEKNGVLECRNGKDETVFVLPVRDITGDISVLYISDNKSDLDKIASLTTSIMASVTNG